MTLFSKPPTDAELAEARSYLPATLDTPEFTIYGTSVTPPQFFPLSSDTLGDSTAAAMMHMFAGYSVTATGTMTDAEVQHLIEQLGLDEDQP